MASNIVDHLKHADKLKMSVFKMQKWVGAITVECTKCECIVRILYDGVKEVYDESPSSVELHKV